MRGSGGARNKIERYREREKERVLPPSSLDTSEPRVWPRNKDGSQPKALLCEIAVSCPRIADRPPDPFSDPPNSTMGPDQPGRHSRRSQSGPPRTSIQPSRIGRQGSWNVRDASSRRSRAVRTLGRTQISSDLRWDIFYRCEQISYFAI